MPLTQTLKEIQDEVYEWSLDNFGDQESWKPLLGIGEEVGELNHAYLKRSQGIRTNEAHDEAIEDAVADILIYLCDFCSREKIDLEATLIATWDRVKKRNWADNPATAEASTDVDISSERIDLFAPTEGE